MPATTLGYIFIGLAILRCYRFRVDEGPPPYLHTDVSYYVYLEGNHYILYIYIYLIT